MPGPSAAPHPASTGFGAGQLLGVLRDGRPRTRAELAGALGVARSTTGIRIGALMSAGLVDGIGGGDSTGGRPPALLALRPSARFVLAADLGARHARFALADLTGVPVAEAAEPLSIADGPDAVLGRVARSADQLLRSLGRDRDDLAAVGIGLPGPVRHATGRPWNPPIMPGWHDVDVPGMAGELLGAPVLVDNDVNIMALGELAAHPGTDDLLFVKVATGIGAGVISDGRLRRGAAGVAGDLGHVRVARGDGVRCTCGQDGCLEALASGPALADELTALRDRAGAHGGRGRDRRNRDTARGRSAVMQPASAPTTPVRTAADVARLVTAGDRDAIAAVRQAGRDLGEVLAGAVNLLGPSVIVIGGALAAAGEHLLAGVREVVYQRSTPAATEQLQIVLSRTREQAAVRGAAILALDHALDPRNIDALLRTRAPSH